MHATLLERFENKISPEPNSGCWLWTGYTVGGYGHIGVRNDPMDSTKGLHQEAAHRVSWELYRAPIPEGMFVCHKCDNPPCVNPDHLFVGTHQDNVDDKMQKGRQDRGSQRSYAKLTESDVRKIRRRWANGASQTSLAVEYGIDQSHMSKIIRRLKWKHVA